MNNLLLEPPNNNKYKFFQCITNRISIPSDSSGSEITVCERIYAHNYKYIKHSELLFLNNIPFASARFDPIRLKLAFQKHQVSVVEKIPENLIV